MDSFYSPEFEAALLRLPVSEWPTPVQGLAHIALEWMRSPEKGRSVSRGEESEAANFLLFCQAVLLGMGSNLIQQVEAGEADRKSAVTFSNVLTYFSRGAGPFAQFLGSGELVSAQADQGVRGRAAGAAGMVHLLAKKAVENGAVDKQALGSLETGWSAVLIILGREAEIVAESWGDEGESEMVLV